MQHRSSARPDRVGAGICTLAVFLLNLPGLATAVERDAIREAKALETSRDFVSQVVSSGRADLVDLRALERAQVREHFPVHHPDTGREVYGLVPVMADDGRVIGIVAVDPAGEDFVSCSFSYAAERFPRVPEGEARRRVAEHAGEERAFIPVESPVLIEGYDGRLYWRFGGSEETWLIDSERPAVPLLRSGDRAAEKALTPGTALRTPRQRQLSDRARRAQSTPSPLRSLPPAYDIPGVPYHYQVENVDCLPTSLQMVMDFHGEEIPQVPITDVTNTSPVTGSAGSDLMRAARFSGMSTAMQDPTLQGYAERQLGYASTDWNWVSDPDPGGALKRLICAHHPVIGVGWTTPAHTGRHARVAKGYDDGLGVFIFHDPGTAGPNFLIDQTVWLDDLWADSDRWGLVASPWRLWPTIPSTVAVGDTFAVDLIVHYPGPDSLAGWDQCTTCQATVSLPSGLSLVGGTAVQSLPDLVSGESATVSWDVVANGPAGELGIAFQAQGLLTAFSQSYPGYTDSIGGHGYDTVVLESPLGPEWEDEVRLTADVGSSKTCRPGGRTVAIGEDGTIHVVWADTRDGNSEVYYRNRIGSVWGPETRLTTDAGYSHDPIVACGADSSVHVAWVDTRDSGDLEIYYKYREGSTWSAEERVTSFSGPDAWPSVAVGADEVYLAWERKVSAVFARKFAVFFSARSDTGWSAPVDVESTGLYGSFRPSLAWGGDDLLHVAYERASNTPEMERIRHRSWDGTSWSAFTAFGSAVSFSRGPVIEAGEDSTLHVVWQDGKNVGGDIFYISYNGSAWQPREQIVTGAADVSTPSVTADDLGNVYVVWEDCRSAEPELYFKSRSGGVWSENERLTFAQGASSLPTIAAGSGTVCVAWTDSRDGNAEIYFRARPTGTGTAVMEGLTVPPGEGAVSLSPPFPVPFVSRTRFSFSLAEPTNVSLNVFDVAGRHVRSLTSGRYGAGTHWLHWEGRNTANQPVAPGVYFIRCATPAGGDVRRVVRLR